MSLSPLSRLWRAPLPERYAPVWCAPFDEKAAAHMRPGSTILDLGGGASPAFPVGSRPASCTYIGLDISADELARAPAGTYDEVYVSDAAMLVDELVGRCDLIVSWQVLEHVRPLGAVLDNCRAYLKPGGTLVALFTGAYAYFALAGRVVPTAVAKHSMRRLLGRDPGTVFPAHYDQTWYTALQRRMTDGWENVEIVPFYRGAWYLTFAPPLLRLYLAYENWVVRNDRRNLATHYLVSATKAGPG
jgi:2-polyprenyl-6-hydroxyphenyl methylase/3-demethylubiquinone-9 3-methyltransferase